MDRYVCAWPNYEIPMSIEFTHIMLNHKVRYICSLEEGVNTFKASHFERVDVQMRIKEKGGEGFRRARAR
jgi:hypothetical protein